MNLGSGGGGGFRYRIGGAGGDGGPGGGIVYLAAKTLNVGGNILANGYQGTYGTDTIGGSGSGGSILIRTSTAIFGNIQAVGGIRSSGWDGYGGAGGVGRIRIEYCESFSGSTNPPASTQKLNCYIAEQVESAPYTTTRLNLPESFSNGRTYQIQYGRRLVFGGAGEQVTAPARPRRRLHQRPPGRPHQRGRLRQPGIPPGHRQRQHLGLGVERQRERRHDSHQCRSGRGLQPLLGFPRRSSHGHGGCAGEGFSEQGRPGAPHQPADDPHRQQGALPAPAGPLV
jgi:hypothetical protein